MLVTPATLSVLARSSHFHARAECRSDDVMKPLAGLEIMFVLPNDPFHTGILINSCRPVPPKMTCSYGLSC